MNKKLMAVAVAGVLSAPGVVLAQGATVSVYGTINSEYGSANAPGVDQKSYDGFNGTGSNMGFKGEEKLGGGLSAFFQCESDLRFLTGKADDTTLKAITASTGVLCDRNSALGLKGNFGSVYVGTWDSPLKKAVGVSRMIGDTGWLGVTHLLLDSNTKWSNRNANSINYDSPAFNGLTVGLQTTTTNAANGQTADGKKGRQNGANLVYRAGPLEAALGYSKKEDNTSNAAAAGGSDVATSLGATYTTGALKVGITFVNMETKTALGVGTERDAWNLAGAYTLSGPHSVVVGYTSMGDKGTAASTGAKEVQVSYVNALSKRTFAAIGYGRVSNDSAGTSSIAGAFTAPAGSSSSVVSLQVKHAF